MMSLMREDLREVKDAVKEIAAAIVRLAVLEEKYQSVSAAQERGFTEISDHDTRLRALEQSQPAQLEPRIRALELAQPMHNLTSGWITSALWAVAAVLGSVILKKLGVL